MHLCKRHHTLVSFAQSVVASAIHLKLTDTVPKGANKRTRCHVGPRPARLQEHGLSISIYGQMHVLQATWVQSADMYTCKLPPVISKGMVRACVSSTPLPDMALAMPTSAILHVSVRVSRQLLLLMSMCRICARTHNQGHASMHAIAFQKSRPLLTYPGAETVLMREGKTRQHGTCIGE